MNSSRHNDLLLTASLARSVAQTAAAVEDPELCDSDLLLELLALADRAEERLRDEAPDLPI